MATYGEIRFRLKQLCPEVALDLLDGWIQDRYAQILDRLPWQRNEVVASLQTVAEYADGTITVSQGSNIITGSGTNWTSAMDGRMLRIAAQGEFFSFAFGSTNSGTLDRPYEGASAATLPYQLNQPIVQLPANARYCLDVTNMTTGRPLLRPDGRTPDPMRSQYGSPMVWAPFMDLQSDPPIPQIELVPCPTAVEGLLVKYMTDVTAPGQTSATLLPWMRPAAIIVGVQASAAKHAKDWNGGTVYEADFERLVSDMVRNECIRIGPTRLKMADAFTRHRARRWCE